MARLVIKFARLNETLHEGLIPFELKVHAEAHSLEEEWSGKTSKDERRKLQNRLNQRAYRRRKIAEREATAKANSEIDVDVAFPDRVPLEFDTDDETSRTVTGEAAGYSSFENSPVLDYGKPDSQDQLEGNDSLVGASQPSPVLWCATLEESLANLGLNDHIELPVPGCQGVQVVSNPVKFEAAFLSHPHASDLYPGSADHLLNLMYYNVFRALVRNVESLFLDMELMHSNDYPSPFTPNNVNTIRDISCIPPHFRPTPIQQAVTHHPCFDIFPDPALRDNGILNSYRLPHGKLCLTLAGRETWYEKDLLKRNGMVIWGDSVKIESWEVTEGFAANWPWLLEGAWSLEKSTNEWRRLRGEPPIHFA